MSFGRGIDISSAQGLIDFKAAAEEIDFVIIKASEGTTYTNPLYASSYAAAIEAGLGVSSYHYAAWGSPEAEAAYALTVIPSRAHSLGLDIETSTDSEWINAWCDYVQSKGVQPYIYGSLDSISKVATSYPLWIADWSWTGQQLPNTILIQTSDKGSVAGVAGDVDLDVAGAALSEYNNIFDVAGDPLSVPSSPAAPPGAEAAAFDGSLPSEHIKPAAPIVGIAPLRSGNGYWLVGADGGVFAFGNAKFYGSLPSEHIKPAAPIVGIATMPGDQGYWLVGADGGVFAFGG